MTTLSQDVSLEGLRTSIMLLETELSVLGHRRADLYRLMNTFRVRYNAELGMLLGDILRLRLEEFKRLRDGNPDVQVQIEEAERDLEVHDRTTRDVREEVVQTLSKARDKELQQKFHRASKLCHPDLVDESQKAYATQLFMDLNNAYAYNNLERVTAILEMLEKSSKGLLSRLEGLTTRALLEMHENRLRIDIERLKQEIADVRGSETYRAVEEIPDWDAYFEVTREKLQREKELLQKRTENSNGRVAP